MGESRVQGGISPNSHFAKVPTAPRTPGSLTVRNHLLKTPAKALPPGLPTAGTDQHVLAERAFPAAHLNHRLEQHKVTEVTENRGGQIGKEGQQTPSLAAPCLEPKACPHPQC